MKEAMLHATVGAISGQGFELLLMLGGLILGFALFHWFLNYFVNTVFGNYYAGSKFKNTKRIIFGSYYGVLVAGMALVLIVG